MSNRTVRVVALVALVGGLGAALLIPIVHAQMPPTPTKEHQSIVSRAGKWEGTLISYYPGSPPDPMPATETVEAIGPYWVQTRFECSFMGMSYIGTGATGYDPDKKKCVGTWIDNMSTYVAQMEGSMDLEKNTITMHWKAPGFTGEITDHRNETVIHSDDHYTTTFFLKNEGKDTKVMVIEMHRKKGEKGKSEEKAKDKSKEKKMKGGASQ